MTDAIIAILRVIHYAALAFGALGWLVPVNGVLIAYLIFMPLLCIHWQINKDSCLLDNAESWLRHGQFRAGEVNPNEGSFLANLIHQVFGIRVVEPLASRLIYIVMGIFFVFGAIHLARRW